MIPFHSESINFPGILLKSYTYAITTSIKKENNRKEEGKKKEKNFNTSKLRTSTII
jgi:hypothetical protein